MGRVSLLLSAVMVLGCGGRAKQQGVSGLGGAEAGVDDAGGAAGVEAGATAGAAGAVPPSYVPVSSNVTPVGDGRLEGGGFDRPQGEGWDTCYTTTPGMVRSGDAPEERFLRFDS